MARPGDKIGPYTLIRKVGKGGFGEVWLAEKKTRIATTEFAVKLPIEENPDIDAIRQEAELWKQASGHPNILPIIEADIYDELIVIVSEFARGGSLKDWLKTHRGAAPSFDAAIQMISGILSGLEHLHSLRIIHRDLKPENVLLQGNRPRLADFGLARVLKSSMFSQTVAGTPEYMAPEAFMNERSEQADLWAAGVMLYQMITGDLPFPFSERMSPWQKMAVITSQDITPPPLSVPEPLRKVLIHSLEKKPEQRYRSASEMLASVGEANDALKNTAREQIKPHPIQTIPYPLTLDSSLGGRTFPYPLGSNVPLEETEPVDAPNIPSTSSSENVQDTPASDSIPLSDPVISKAIPATPEIMGTEKQEPADQKQASRTLRKQSMGWLRPKFVWASIGAVTFVLTGLIWLALDSKPVQDRIPLTIGEVVSRPDINEATITWSTDEPADAQVEYGTSTSYENASILISSLEKEHSVILTGLAVGGAYHYRVKSRDAHGNEAISEDRVLTMPTPKLPTPNDNAPPRISSVITRKIIADKATITWITNEPSSTQVEYGTTDALEGLSALKTSLEMNHIVVLAGLLPNTKYYYRVKSQDAAGNPAISNNLTFTTPPTSADNQGNKSAIPTTKQDEVRAADAESQPLRARIRAWSREKKRFVLSNLCAPLYFAINSARIRGEHMACLDEIAIRMQQEPTASLVIHGHRDSSEREGISLTRGNNARDYLVNQKGIDGNRITVRNSSDTSPDPSGYSNRRVEF